MATHDIIVSQQFTAKPMMSLSDVDTASFKNTTCMISLRNMKKSFVCKKDIKLKSPVV